MFASPRVIAIDDDPKHLAGLANSLNHHGVACLQIHFTGDPTGIKSCPDVRIIFADLHLGEGRPASDHKQDFGVIGGLLEDTIKPSGPYFILLWTKYADQAPALQEFLERLQDVTKPFAVLPLAKADHLDAEGHVTNERELIKAIDTLTEKLPQIAALFDWESRVLRATGSTVSSLLKLTAPQEVDKKAEEVGRILVRLGIEAVGKDHADNNRFRAVNEALLPILADRIANMRSSESDDEVWQAALDVAGSTDLSLQEAAKLNRLVNIADARRADGFKRGVIVSLPEPFRGDFKGNFGIDERNAAFGQFRCKDFALGDDHFRWVLVQAQAACDHAQTQPGPVPFYLGLDLPQAQEARNRKPPAPLWRSPAFEFDGEIRLLHVSARFPISLSPNTAHKAAPRYRLREQILNGLIYHLHGHGARPGMISFR